jgi:hypothetical protein
MDAALGRYSRRRFDSFAPYGNESSQGMETSTEGICTFRKKQESKTRHGVVGSAC